MTTDLSNTGGVLMLKPFEQSDLLSIADHAAEPFALKHPDYSEHDISRMFACGGPAFTGIVDGRVVACGGVVDRGDGSGEAWMVFDSRMKAHRLGALRAMRYVLCSLFGEGVFDRIDASVADGFACGERLAAHLGFRRAGIDTDRADGATATIFTKTRGLL